MRAIVTGGAGFIGSHLTDRLLEEGSEVLVIDDLSTGRLENLQVAVRSDGNLSVRMMSILATELEHEFMAFEPDVVFHLAAQSSVAVSMLDPFADAQANILGSLRVLEAARRACASKVVVAASGGTLYGDLEDTGLPLKETAPYQPSSPYGISKRVMLDYLDFFRKQREVPSCALAFANVYGPRQDPAGEAGVIAIFSERARQQRPLLINGDGQQSRDFVHVADVVDALVRAARFSCSPVINIGTGIETSITTIARTILELSGSSAGVSFQPGKPGEVRRTVLDPGTANRDLGWFPTICLRDGIASLLQAMGTDTLVHNG